MRTFPENMGHEIQFPLTIYEIKRFEYILETLHSDMEIHIAKILWKLWKKIFLNILKFANFWNFDSLPNWNNSKNLLIHPRKNFKKIKFRKS